MRAILFIFLCTILLSCEKEFSTDPVDNNMRATFTEINQSVFQKQCSCHLQGQTPSYSGDVYNTLVNKPSSTGAFYILPAAVKESYLFKKITGSAAISGERMPLGGPYLTQAEIDTIQVWIAKGALNN